MGIDAHDPVMWALDAADWQDGDLLALRYQRWKIHFHEQRSKGLAVWREPFADMRVPKLFDLRSDPFERGPTSILYADWHAHRAFLLVPAQAVVAKYVESFKEFPPRTKPASFTVGDVLEKLTETGANKN